MPAAHACFGVALVFSIGVNAAMTPEGDKPVPQGQRNGGGAALSGSKKPVIPDYELLRVT
jgi:hypothetical protein